MALHAAVCNRCALLLGQLCAARASVALPDPVKASLPRAFWRGVRVRLDEVDGLIRAAEGARYRRQPLVAPWVMVTATMAIVFGIVGKLYLVPHPEMPNQLTRLHMAASLGPHDPGGWETVGFRTHSDWHPLRTNLFNMNGVMVLQTIYSVGGLTVSVFRLPAGTLNTDRLVSRRMGREQLYLAAFDRATMAAREAENGWDVVVARSPVEDTINLALTCPPQASAVVGY